LATGPPYSQTLPEQLSANIIHENKCLSVVTMILEIKAARGMQTEILFYEVKKIAVTAR
jgi:hypothetical protein